MPYARRTDANLTAIIDAYKALGCSVDPTNSLWDLSIGYGGICELVEVKNPAQHIYHQRYTKRQLKWRETWTGGCRLIKTIEDVAIHVNEIRFRHAAYTAAVRDRTASRLSSQGFPIQKLETGVTIDKLSHLLVADKPL